MATATLPKTFDVFCPLCNEGENITLNLNDLGQCYCESCSEPFTVAKAIAEATERLAAWQKVARFVEMGRQLAAE
jgi:hypothetical protein